MYLSNKDLKRAIDTGKLIVDPYPVSFGRTSIDVHLDAVSFAKVWNVEQFSDDMQNAGHQGRQLKICRFKHQKFGERYYQDPPDVSGIDEKTLVYRVHNEIVVRPHGFLVWQTKEQVGTPAKKPSLICFVEGKSTLARTGVVVHLTAPTIHAGWWGKITLEIANLGPFDVVLNEDDVIAQILVARISSAPSQTVGGSIAVGQADVTGAASTTAGLRNQNKPEARKRPRSQRP